MNNLDAIATLSPASRSVLISCWWAALSAAGGDFGFSDEAYAEWRQLHPDGSQQQFAGAYGLLATKRLIYSDDEAEVNGKLLGSSQYDFPEDVREYLETLTA